MKKSIVIICVIALFSFISLAAANAVLAANKTIELKVSSWSPSQLDIARVTEEWGRKIEEQSGGAVKFVFYWSQTLAAYKDAYRVVQSGVADIGNYVIGLNQGLHPLNEFTTLPLIGWKDIFVATKVYHEMRNKFPELDAEFKGLRNIYTTAMAPSQVHVTKGAVHTTSDMRGLRLITSSPSMIALLQNVNAVAVAKGPPDWYMSLEKGLADGNMLHWAAVDGFKLEELYASHTDAGEGGFGTSFYGWWINGKTWKKLPQKARQAFIDLQDWVQQEDLKLNTKLIARGHTAAQKMGHPIYQLTDEEMKSWRDAAQPVHDKWISDVASKNLPAREVYDTAMQLIDEYNNQ